MGALQTSAQTKPQGAVRPPSFAEALRFWIKLGFISFGGPTGQIAIMQSELVEKKRWISQARFLHALNYCMLLPGPEAHQLAIYVGWLLHRIPGGVVAGAFFVMPSMFILWGLSFVYAAHGSVPWIAAIFYGLKPAVIAIVATAVSRIGKKALKNEVMWCLALVAFLTIFFFKVQFPAIVVAAGGIGFLGGRLFPQKFNGIASHEPDSSHSVLGDDHESPAHTKPSWSHAIKVLLVCLALWWSPILIAVLCLGWRHTVSQQGIFFSKAAMLTFGGAYAVLPYVAQQAVEHYAWLKPNQMLDGLGLAETTPGPLLIVLQFVGFLGAWNHPSELPSVLSATLGACITSWATFAPSFLWIFLGGPHIEQFRGNAKVSTILSAITAAIVGVVLNFAVWLALSVLWPKQASLDGFALVLSVVVFYGIMRYKWNVISVAFASGLLGLLYKSLMGA